MPKQSVNRRRAVIAAISALTLVSGISSASGGGLPISPPTTPPTVSAVTAIGAIAPKTPVLHFKGSLNNPGPLPTIDNPDPVVCAIKCWEYSFRDNRPGTPVLVSLKSTVAGPHGEFEMDDGFDLYVYGPDQKMVSDANGIGSNGQAALIPKGQRGTYTFVVTFTYAEDAEVGYTGQVRMLAGKTWKPPKATCGISVDKVKGCFNLPRLRALAPYDLTTKGIPPIASTPLGFPIPVDIPTPTSCYADEMIGLDNVTVTNLNDPITRCLRFTTDIQNVGAGPLNAQIPLLATDGKGKVAAGYIPGDCNASQVVERANGASVSRPAGPCEFHTEHAHFHYDGLLGYGLYRVGKHGLPAGKVIGASKASFCLTDDDYFGYGSARLNGPRNNVGQPDCNVPRSFGIPTTGKPNTGTFVSEGMTPGWGDVYTWDTPGQFINVTHVKAGTYDLVEETNPNGRIVVAGPTHTCAMTRLRLTIGSSFDSAAPIASRASIPCPKDVGSGTNS
jgi:hypothetical protein